MNGEEALKKTSEKYQVVVAGGGLAGFCAAVAAARHGAQTCLIQDRPVFGGNSSSEIRVTPHGAANFHAYARETGILSELLIEERARNHEEIFENGWTNSVWDLTMYDMAMKTPNLSFHLNTSVQAVVKDGDKKIQSLLVRVANAETEIKVFGDIFIDCTGDGVVADWAGCEWRMGSEGRDEFGEPHAPETASGDTMGNSIHFKTVNMGRPVPFEAPDWAVKHEDPSFFYDQGRHTYDIRGGYWWIEIGVPWHTIYESEDIRHELTRHTLGIWDWIKNKDPKTKELAANYALDWVGQVPGKRESRRIMGEYFMTEHDPINRTVFEDEIAYGGWFLDLHTPGGLLAPTSEPASAEGYSETSDYAIKSYCGPYGIPLRILLAKDMDNLMMAGRNVSVTHAALGTVRVMATTALMGQAAGTSAAIALKNGISMKEVTTKAMKEVQQNLLRDGCFLPNVVNEHPGDLARQAVITASSEMLLNGAGPETQDQLPKLQEWNEPQTGSNESLRNRRGQWIAIASPEIESLSVCLTNHSDEPQQIRAALVNVDHIWDYRMEPKNGFISSTLLIVPPGGRQWVKWQADLGPQDGLKAQSYVRLELDAHPHITWHAAGSIITGHVSAFEMGKGRMRRFDRGVTMSYLISPAQSVYGASNVISGVTRPYQYTNLWKSDPALPLPQWVQLAWEKSQFIRTVEITFPGHLIREYHAYASFYRDPQCAKDYRVQAYIGDEWQDVISVKGNYQRHVRHQLDESVLTSKLRVVVDATNGDPSAAIYEVRCYA
nr:FAD-dependent oxidoreductase [Paenibacillus anseongense]